MDVELVKQISDFGLAAVMLLIVVLWKRSDDQRHMAELSSLVSRQDEREKQLMQLVADNTAALRALEHTISQLLTVNELEDRITRRSGGGRAP